MVNRIYNTDFATLRKSYVEVKHFLETEGWEKVNGLNTRIVNDLGLSGDDNYELLAKFVNKYRLNSTDFDYSKHFLSEAELFGSGPALLNLLSVPIIITVWLLKLLTLGKLDLTTRKLNLNIHRDVSDMNFGDMLTWYITGRYNLRNEIRMVLSKTR